MSKFRNICCVSNLTYVAGTEIDLLDNFDNKTSSMSGETSEVGKLRR